MPQLRSYTQVGSVQSTDGIWLDRVGQGTVWVTAGAFMNANGTPLGYQQITSLSAAQTLTVPAGSTYALIQAESVDVRWRDDGGTPTSGAGMLLAAGVQETFGGDLAALKFIQTAASAVLNVSYYQ